MIDEPTVAGQAPAQVYAAASLPPSVSPTPRPAKVLLIEPDPDCADALATILASLPRVDTVDVVASLREATRVLQSGAAPPAIILVDDQPGSTDIMRAIDILRALAPATALVLLCVYPQCIDRRVRSRVDGCVSKDVSRPELDRVIGTALRSS